MAPEKQTVHSMDEIPGIIALALRDTWLRQNSLEFYYAPNCA
jgi:hypothetical protein